REQVAAEHARVELAKAHIKFEALQQQAQQHQDEMARLREAHDDMRAKLADALQHAAVLAAKMEALDAAKARAEARADAAEQAAAAARASEQAAREQAAQLAGQLAALGELRPPRL
ncbi:MAG: hypothetical protein N2690_07200, partial [Rhodocyclaceae bacterium]|nr:hypothetical protein [Rhodocyclaceae bacterium]